MAQLTEPASHAQSHMVLGSNAKPVSQCAVLPSRCVGLSLYAGEWPARLLGLNRPLTGVIGSGHDSFS